MATPQSIIKSALRKFGAIASGENPAPEEQEDGRTELNRLLSDWNAEGLMANAIQRVTQVLVASTASYTIGASATINTTRPARIEAAGLIPFGMTQEYEIQVLTDKKWEHVFDKAQTGTPYSIYYQPTVTTGVIYPFFVPDQAHTLVLYLPVRFDSVAAGSGLTTDYALPDGYESALIWNLALGLAPEYGKGASPDVMGMIASKAANSKNRIKLANAQPMEMRSDPALLGHRGEIVIDSSAFKRGY